MSSVTDMFVIIGDSEDGLAEAVAPKVAKAIWEAVYAIPAREYGDDCPVEDFSADIPIISLERDDWPTLQHGSKVAGSAVIWFGWNYAQPDELVDHLKAGGFKHITVWSHHELSDDAPRVVSW
jgi:hypothetical protein